MLPYRKLGDGYLSKTQAEAIIDGVTGEINELVEVHKGQCRHQAMFCN